MTKWLVVLLGFGLVLRLVLSTHIYSGDVNNHMAWGHDLLHAGPSGMYAREFMSRYGTTPPTYPPVALFMFATSQAMYEASHSWVLSANTSWSVFPSVLVWWYEDQDTRPAFFKLWAIAADIGLGLVTYLLLSHLGHNQRLAMWLTSLLVIFNPALIYNSSYWGQVESVPLFFLFTGLYIYLRFRLLFATTLLLLLAILTKQSTIIFLPLLFLYVFPNHKPLYLFKALSIFIVGFYLLFLPFGVNPITTYVTKLQTGSGSDHVVEHAFNLWYLVPGLGQLSDSTPVIGPLNYRHLSYLLYLVTYSTIGYWLFRHSTPQKLFQALGLIIALAFLVLTRMHERYLLPAIPLFGVGFAQYRFFWVLTYLLSLINLANHYHNWWAPRIPTLVSFLQSPTTLLVLIVATYLAFVGYYFRYFRS